MKQFHSYTLRTAHSAKTGSSSILFIGFFVLLCASVQSQNVGIGTTAPAKLLSVNGSLLIDQENRNGGTVDSAALLFGSASLVGISSNRFPGGPNADGLDFWTNGNRRISISSNGNLGISTATPQYRLDVNGFARVSYLYTTGLHSYASIITDVDLIANDDLTVADDATIYGNVGIGGSVYSNYTLRVQGNGLFTTNVGIDGTLRVDNKITNGGKGIMKSNTSTTLRSGFTSGTFSLSLTAGSSSEIPFCVIPFTGGNSNVRVMVCQFSPGSGASATAGNVTFNVVDVASSGGACGGGSTATIRISNATNSTINLGTDAVLYLYSVVVD